MKKDANRRWAAAAAGHQTGGSASATAAANDTAAGGAERSASSNGGGSDRANNCSNTNNNCGIGGGGGGGPGSVSSQCGGIPMMNGEGTAGGGVGLFTRNCTFDSSDSGASNNDADSPLYSESEKNSRKCTFNNSTNNILHHFPPGIYTNPSDIDVDMNSSSTVGDFYCEFVFLFEPYPSKKIN